MVSTDKQCSKCGNLRPQNEYYRQKRYDKNEKLYFYYNKQCKTCEKKRNSKYREENPHCRDEAIKRYNSRPEKIKQIKEANLVYRESGKARLWQRNHNEKVKEYNKFRALHKTHEITKDEWEYCKVYFNNSCAYCGMSEQNALEKYKNRLHREHVYHEGANDISNCVPACKGCNSSKGTNPIEAWYNESNLIFDSTKLAKIYIWIERDYKSSITSKIK